MTTTDPIFHTEAKAAAHMGALRWNGEPACPHCGSLTVTPIRGTVQADMGWFAVEERTKARSVTSANCKTASVGQLLFKK